VQGEESSIARRVQKRDPEAWGILYEEYFPKLYRYIALRVGNKAEAEDLIEQVFVKAFESIPSFRWRGVPISAWLFRIAHNQVVDHLRKATRSKTLSVGEFLGNNDAEPEAMAKRNMTIEQLAGAMGTLTQAQRDVIQLRFAGGLSTAQVAKIPGKSQGAVKALQHSALATLRRSFSSWSNNEKTL
jgi:RNA polymerase sigma-70 factor (ECF subfamily)